MFPREINRKILLQVQKDKIKLFHTVDTCLVCNISYLVMHIVKIKTPIVKAIAPPTLSKTRTKFNSEGMCRKENLFTPLCYDRLLDLVLLNPP
jgi:hypothetical protein